MIKLSKHGDAVVVHFQVILLHELADLTSTPCLLQSCLWQADSPTLVATPEDYEEDRATQSL